MCSVLGCYLENPTEEQISTLKSLLLESRIRGRHATGISLIDGESVVTYKEAVPSDIFVESEAFKSVQPGNYTLQVIGHTRYSTSDLRYNQPIQISPSHAIAHNGVVDQRSPSHWKDYGYELETANDSELIYHCVSEGGEPLLRFPDASMAVVELSSEKGLRWYRNGKRPLYHSKQENGWFICSTADIAKRAGLHGAKLCSPGFTYTPFTSQQIKPTVELIAA